MNKKTLLIDMDGCQADFIGGIKKYCPDLHAGDYENTYDKVNEICQANPRIFLELEPLPGAIEAVHALDKMYDIYFVSTPMDDLPESFMDKRLWLKKHFGDLAKYKLKLTHHKNMVIGDYLIDDTTRNGVLGFKGEHIHFGTDKFPDWKTTVAYLTEKYEQNSLEEYYDQERKYGIEIIKHNSRLLRVIERYKGHKFYEELSDYLGFLNTTEKLTLSKKYTGNSQKENYSKIKTVWIDQWSTGPESDCFSGYAYIKLKPGKYLKVYYES